jgi:hypothetical protein
MNAKKAREVAEVFILERDRKQVESFEKLINYRAKHGFMDVNVHEEIFPKVVTWLTASGYVMTKSPDGRDGEVTYKIEW